MVEEFLNLSDIDPDNHFNIACYIMDTPYLTVSEYNSHNMHQISSLVFYNFNIRSFNPNSVSFMSTFREKSTLPPVLVLTETWFKDTGEELGGYSSHHTIRNSEHRSGGVSIYIEYNIKSKFVHNLSFSNGTIEICTVQIEGKDFNIFILGIYRPHSDTVENFIISLRNILESDILRNKHLVLLGDLNINLLCENSNVNSFTNFMQSYYLIPVIHKPTRFQSGYQNGTLLDHIWTNKPLNNYNCGIVLCDISDHCPTFFALPFNINSRTETFRSVFRVVDEESKCRFIESISNCDWTPIDNRDVNYSVEYFISQLNLMYCKSFA